MANRLSGSKQLGVHTDAGHCSSSYRRGETTALQENLRELFYLMDWGFFCVLQEQIFAGIENTENSFGNSTLRSLFKKQRSSTFYFQLILYGLLSHSSLFLHTVLEIYGITVIPHCAKGTEQQQYKKHTHNMQTKTLFH